MWWQLFANGLAGGAAREHKNKSHCIDDEASDAQLQNRTKDSSNNGGSAVGVQFRPLSTPRPPQLESERENGTCGAAQIQTGDDVSPAVARPAWTPVGSVLMAPPRVQCI